MRTGASKWLSSVWDGGVLRRSGIYLASGSASALIAFLLLPVLTRYLSPGDYGVVEIFTTFATCLTGVLLVGGNTILAKEYFNLDAPARAHLIGGLLGLLAITTAFAALGLAIVQPFGESLRNWVGVTPAVLWASWLFAATTGAGTLFTTLLQLEKNATFYALFVNGKSLIEFSLSLFLLVVLGWHWEGRMLGMLIGSFLFGIWGTALLWRRGSRLRFNGNELGTFCRLGLPLVAAHVSVWAYGMVDRVLISARFDLDTTGLYSVGFRFATVVSMVETAFSLAWMPFFFESIARRDPIANARVVRLTYLYILGLLAFAMAFAFAAQWLLPIMVDARFRDAGQFTTVLCLAFWCSGCWKMFNGYLIAKSQTRLYGWITVITALLHVALAWSLLRLFGPVGAAWATLATFAFATTATIIAAVRLHPMPWTHAFSPSSTGSSSS